MTPSDLSSCTGWIREYIEPAAKVNRMHTSKGLWKMMLADTGANVSHTQFKDLMLSCGYEPVFPLTEDWEFMIGNKKLRNRPNAEVAGWQASQNPYKRTRWA